MNPRTDSKCEPRVGQEPNDKLVVGNGARELYTGAICEQPFLHRS